MSCSIHHRDGLVQPHRLRAVDSDSKPASVNTAVLMAEHYGVYGPVIEAIS